MQKYPQGRGKQARAEISSVLPAFAVSNLWGSYQPLNIAVPSLRDPTIRVTQSILWTIVPNIKQSAQISLLAPQP